MTLILYVDLHIWKSCLHAENEVCRQVIRELEAGGQQTDRRDRMHYRTAFVGGNDTATNRLELHDYFITMTYLQDVTNEVMVVRTDF